MGYSKQARSGCLFRDQSESDPLDYRGDTGFLREDVYVSLRMGKPMSGSQFDRDGAWRISDTRVLCVVVATHWGTAESVAVETRARPVHLLARLKGAREPARNSPR